METEKIYCTDGGNNALAMAALANSMKGGDGKGAEMAALMNGMGNQWNNPFIYLVWMMFAQRMWGNGGNGSDGANTQSIEVMSKLNDLGAQISSNQNTNLTMDAINGNHEALHSLATNLGVSVAQLQGAIGGVQNAITQLGGQVGMSAQQVINGVLLGNKDLTSAITSCCCENKQLVQQMGYQNQLAVANQNSNIQMGFANSNTVIERGFSQAAYASQQQACNIINAGNANTQRIIDTLNNHWSTECSQALQDAKFEISQLKQNQYLVNAINNGGTACGCN